MIIIYIILFILCFISAFASLSNGAIFSETVKGIITLIYYAIVIALSIISILITGEWYYIILIPVISLIISWGLAFILTITVFKK